MLFFSKISSIIPPHCICFSSSLYCVLFLLVIRVKGADVTVIILLKAT